MFQDVLNDINSGKDVTGAKSVVTLFNAIGLSAEPLQGKGFRINKNTVQEHVNARGLGGSLYQKLLAVKNGDVITPDQIKDYADIAVNSPPRCLREQNQRGPELRLGSFLPDATRQWPRAGYEYRPDFPGPPTVTKTRPVKLAASKGWKF